MKKRGQEVSEYATSSEKNRREIEDGLHQSLYDSIKTPSSKKAPPPPPPIPRNIEKRDLLVFVVYYNVGTQSEAKTSARIAEIRAGLHHVFEDVERYTNHLVKFLIFPIKEGETKMECIFPKNQDKIDLSSLVDLSEEKVKGFTIDGEDSNFKSIIDISSIVSNLTRSSIVLFSLSESLSFLR
jgi:hypothetical protein